MRIIVTCHHHPAHHDHHRCITIIVITSSRSSLASVIACCAFGPPCRLVLYMLDQSISVDEDDFNLVVSLSLLRWGYTLNLTSEGSGKQSG